MNEDLSSAVLSLKAKLHRDLAHAHDVYARGLSALAGQTEEGAIPELRGRVQRQIIALPDMYAESGLTAGEISQRLDYDEANAHTVLKSLRGAKVVEEVEGTKPRRWRMAVKHRRARVLRMSRLVPDGRWTTYGDFSIAVYDNVKMAITVGRVAARNPAFVNPHRVLVAGGVISDNWRDDEGRGPEECERRLREDGIEVHDGVADKAAYIGWEELQALLEEAERASGLEEI
jgi:alkylated DNA nucleotide flippase Atl1